jgi:hypothetical protein
MSMRRVSARSVLALALSVSVPALVRGEDSLVEKAEKAEAAKQTLGNKVDAITSEAAKKKEHAVEAAAGAKERALEAAKEAKNASREAAESLEERAHEAADNAKAYADELKSSLQAKVQQLGSQGEGMVASTKAALKDAVQGVRDKAREALLGAALALDNKTREARKAAREAHWQKLKARYQLDDRPTMEVSEELRDHEYRLARLQRAHDLAEGQHDGPAMARSDTLMEREHARHRERMLALVAYERREKSLNAGEAPSYGEPEE